MSGWALAIDFGTSNTAAAHTSAISGRIETLPLTHQSNLLPSSVYVEGTGTIVTGSAAAVAAHRDPTRFVPSPKRFVGTMPAMLIGGDEIAVEALIAPVLAAVLERALAAHNGTAPTQVVLTHPEDWSDQHIRVLTAAAVRAGIDPAAVVTVPEPRAAAHHYSRASPTDPGTKIAVFDFGGGTLDVAVLAATESGRFEIVSARGDNTLGGKDFDLRIRRWIDTVLDADEPALAEALRSAAPHVQRSIDEQIRTAKELLSESPHASITLDLGAHRYTVTITRDEFDGLIADDIDNAVRLARATLADAGITDPTAVQALYLTGGSARVPLVHTRLGELGPVATLDDPKTVVAQGALLAIEAIPVEGGGLDTVPLTRPAPLAGTGTRPGTTTQERTTARRWWRDRRSLAVAALAGLVGTGIFIAVERGISGDSAATAIASTTVTPEMQESADAFDGVDPRNVTAVLPQPLADQIENCVASGFDTDGNLTVSCDIPPAASLSDHAAEDALSPISISATAVGDTAATQRLLQIRSQADPADVRENETRTAALELSSFSDGGFGTLVPLANSELGLIVNIFDTGGAEEAEAFARESGLFG